MNCNVYYMLHEPAEPASHAAYNNCLPATKTVDNICKDDKEPEIKDEDFNDIKLSNDLENFNLDDHDFEECTFEDGPMENSILEESTFEFEDENENENEFGDLDSKEFCFN